MNPVKKAARNEKNTLGKIDKAIARQTNLALVGKLVFEKKVIDADGNETTVLDFPPAIRTAADGSILPLKESSFNHNPLAFLGAKQYKQHGLSRKNRPGNKELHGEAIVEYAERERLAKEKAALTPEETPIPVIPTDAAPEVAQL